MEHIQDLNNMGGGGEANARRVAKAQLRHSKEERIYEERVQWSPHARGEDRAIRFHTESVHEPPSQQMLLRVIYKSIVGTQKVDDWCCIFHAASHRVRT